jgi:Phage stabilisation protein
MQIPLISGIKTTAKAAFERTYPLNMEPLALDSGISKGQLRMAPGAVLRGTGPGADRGGVEWNGICYRVMGTRLVKVLQDGTIIDLGDVGPGGPVGMDYGFDRLAINSGNRLYYFNGISLEQVTDPDLGPVIDVIWISGFFMTSDGTAIVVTELSDPMQVKPLKYGSAEEDPDMVTGLIKVRNEAYAIGRNTIQVLSLVGGNGFPYVNLKGASIPYGCVSARAKCHFLETFAFVGSSRGASVGVFIAGQGTADRISTPEVDDALASVQNPADIRCETRTYAGESRLMVHLPNETWVFVAGATQAVEEPVWYRVTSGDSYRLRNMVMAYGKMIVADHINGRIGELSEDICTHYGAAVPWEFASGLVYNGAKGGIVKSLELVGMPGRSKFGVDGRVFMSMSRDGETWSLERAIPTGKAGDRARRMVWRPMSRFETYLALKFRGFDASMNGFAALEAEVMPLSK